MNDSSTKRIFSCDVTSDVARLFFQDQDRSG